MNEIDEFIRRALPTLPDDKVVSLSDHLRSEGLESVEDFSCLKEEHLKGRLKPIQIEKLLRFCRTGKYVNSLSSCYYLDPVFSCTAVMV